MQTVFNVEKQKQIIISATVLNQVMFQCNNFSSSFFM
jgi:hypothetical protein